jgi:hypothetical protein
MRVREEVGVRRQLVGMAMVASFALSPAVFAQTPRLVMSEAMIQSSDPGIQLYVRNKHAADMTSFSLIGRCSSFTAQPILPKPVSICQSKAFR